MNASKYNLLLVRNAYKKIQKKFGKSKYYKWIPELIVYSEPNEIWRDRPVCGEFDPNTRSININIANHSSTRKLIDTMLHEYCHYMQHPSWLQRYMMISEYANNPYESDANYFASTHTEEIYRLIKQC